MEILRDVITGLQFSEMRKNQQQQQQQYFEVNVEWNLPQQPFVHIAKIHVVCCFRAKFRKITERKKLKLTRMKIRLVILHPLSQ